MNTKTILASLGLFLLGACQYNGTDFPTPAPGSVVIADRISNQRVNAFTEDRNGHIWMATQRGLNRYDGAEFQQFFSTDDARGLPDNQISDVHALPDGRIWATTRLGAVVSTLEGDFHRVKAETPDSNLGQILETRSGKFLFSNGNSLLAYIPEEDLLRPVIRELNAFGAQALALDREDRLWVISAGGFRLNCYNTEDFSLQSSTPISFQAYHLCDAQDGTLWLTGMGQLGILKADSLQWQPIPGPLLAQKKVSGGDIDLMFAPSGDEMLLSVIGQGFFLYRKKIGRVLPQDDEDFPYTLPEAEIRTLFKDSRGNLWAGTTDKGFGISHAVKSQFGQNRPLVQAFKGKTVTSVCPDKAGNLWVSTLQDGLWCFQLQGKTARKVSVEHLFDNIGVGYIRTTRIFCDSNGNLWLLFMDKGQVTECRWDGQQLRPLHSFIIFYPMSIAEDDQKNIWIGTYGTSLARFDRKTGEISYVNVAQENTWTYVPELLLKEAGRLEACCYNQPPAEVNTYTMEVKKISISETDKGATIRRAMMVPNRLVKDSKGDLWLGTVSNGLIFCDEQSGRKQSVEGLPCPDVCSIEEDRQGNIWVSTMNGLARYDRTTGRFVHFREADGTGGDQYSERASCVLPDGTLVFGGTHGLTCFNPLDAPAKRSIPLVFETLSIHNQLVKPAPDGPIGQVMSMKPEVTIRHNQNAFDISFAALDYSEFEQIRYAYMLEGFDKDWVKIETRHDAYFANVPAGKYTLKVKIANGSHSITETEESLNIRVLPPWYRSIWAIILWNLLGWAFLGSVYLLIRHIHRVRKDAARRIREVRREREKAEEAERAEKELNKIQQNYFANVAHEFRTPLTMIAGPAQQLSQAEDIQGQNKKLVDIIHRNATWLLSLVNQLLDFNRIGNSKLQMKVAHLDIVQPLRDTADLFGFNARTKGIELNTYGLEDPFPMWADADKVQKIVMNLLSNALKFTPSGGRVFLSFDVLNRADAARRFPLTEADQDTQWACISVADSGPGIPEDQLEKIFERYYQSEAGKKSYGSGIGLYYARVLCSLHHGYIKAWNRPEGGALFSLAIPVNEASYTEDERTTQVPQLQTRQLAQDITEENAEEEANKKHVVVIDDDIDIANYLKVMLKPHYKVTLYYDGDSALKGMAQDAPDLIISDVVMPGMDGYELCSHIKADLQLSHIPVVLVTAKVAVENQVEGLDKGADAYVTKPFQPAYLLALVKSLLENREKLRRQLGSVTTTEEIAPEALSPRDAAFMKELYELMEKELANADLDIVRMTEMMKISRTKFYYKVKGLTGDNPSVFFKRYKLNRAADLLKEGKYNMSEIAWMTGFNTLSHFSTSFKKQFGVPPSEYAG